MYLSNAYQRTDRHLIKNAQGGKRERKKEKDGEERGERGRRKGAKREEEGGKEVGGKGEEGEEVETWGKEEGRGILQVLGKVRTNVFVPSATSFSCHWEML